MTTHPESQALNVDALAQELRRVDGKHDLGAGQLAEALMPFLSASQAAAAPIEEPVAWTSPDFRERMERGGCALIIWEKGALKGYDMPLFASPAVAPVAVSVKGLEQLAREIAVTMVDAIHGYTMEFAPSPLAHREEYDRAENAARYALSSIIPAPKGGEDIETLAWECDKWPAWLTSIVDRTNEVADRLDMSSEQAHGYAVLAALSAQDTDGVAK